MAKVITREEKLKKGYSYLYNLNQKLKLISSAYYIGSDGIVYMKSLVPFLETFVTLRYPERYELYHNSFVMPNSFFNFGKRLKKSLLAIQEIDDSEGKRFHFYQWDYPELEWTLNIVDLNTEEIRKRLGYKRIFEIQDSEKYDVYESTYYPVDSNNVDDLCNGKYVEVILPNEDRIPLTRQLFLDVKPTDYIQIAHVASQKIPGEKNQYRKFYLISHDCDLYTSYTIFNRIATSK